MNENRRKPARLLWVIPAAAAVLLFVFLVLRGGPDLRSNGSPPAPPSPDVAAPEIGGVPSGSSPGSAPSQAASGAPVPAGSVVIRGRLMDRGGMPPHARILTAAVIDGLRDGKPDKALRAIPGDGGVFSLPTRDLPGALKISVGYQAQREGTWLVNEVAAKTVPVPAAVEGVSDLGDILLPEADKLCWLEGTAFSSAGKAVSLDDISLESEDRVAGFTLKLASPRPEVGSAPNAPVGYVRGNSFSVCHAPPGRYKLSLSADGHWTSSRPVELVAGQGLTAVTVLMDEAPFAVRGLVTDEVAGTPVAGVSVSLFEAGGGPDAFLGETITANDGTYWLSLRARPKAEDLTLRVEREGFASRKLVVKAAELRSGFALLRDVRLPKSGP